MPGQWLRVTLRVGVAAVVVGGADVSVELKVDDRPQ